MQEHGELHAAVNTSLGGKYMQARTAMRGGRDAAATTTTGKKWCYFYLKDGGGDPAVTTPEGKGGGSC